MNRRSFASSATLATACILSRQSLLAKAPSRLEETRSRLGIQGPIVLRGFFYLGYCPISLHRTTIVHSPLGESAWAAGGGYKNSKAMAYDLLEAIILDRFPNPDEARSRLRLTFSGSPEAANRYPLILGRNHAWSFRKKLGEWFDDARLELPKR